MNIFGTHPIEEILTVAPDIVTRVFCSRMDAPEVEAIRALCAHHKIGIEPISKLEMDERADGNHQGVIAELKGFQYADLDTVLERTDDLPFAKLLILDQVQDPQNLGAILRTAAALGVAGVVIPKDRAASITPTVIRASAGLAFRVAVCQVTNIARTLDLVKDKGFWCVGAFMDDSTPAWDLDFKMKTALVMGSEQKGVRPLVEKKCGFRVGIPMSSGTESLNVGAAAAILMYEMTRQTR